MNWTAYPRHWLRAHVVVSRTLLYVSIYVGWNWRYRRLHLCRGNT